MSREQPQTVRCAIYTRKSTDENLDLEFNSLDAQRESAEAYIASQRSAGWLCLPDRYDDGGYTGGNMERPALKRLLADVAADKVDCIIVYKVDRLSRSLMDFARIIAVLEEHGVSFVSVTQQFNTSTSMGRLVLNVLLSFAQFEREIISERTRDKIAATRRKGKWSGGYPVLGYDVDPKGGRLLLNEGEAERIRAIYKLYLQHEALVPVMKDLDSRGWTNKRWVNKEGRERGGRPFDKGKLYKLLTNVLYTGRQTYKSEVVKGEHPAIVPDDLFERVQLILRRNGRTGGAEVRNKHGALLCQVLVCGSCNCAMVHAYTHKDESKLYRYYVCLNAQKRGWHTCPTKSVSAPKIEQFVVDQVKRIVNDEQLVRETLRQARQEATARSDALVAEEDRQRREVRRLSDEMRKLAAQAGGGEPVAARLSEVQDRTQEAERRLTAVREELAALNREMEDDRELVQAFRQFDPVWEVLSPREKARAIQLLVERVAYNGVEGKVSMTFRPNGLRELAGRLSAKEA
jgi:site-specific DNA recombinase